MFLDKYSKHLKKVESIKSVKDYDPVTMLLKLKLSSPEQVMAIRDAYLALSRTTD